MNSNFVTGYRCNLAFYIIEYIAIIFIGFIFMGLLFINMSMLLCDNIKKTVSLSQKIALLEDELKNKK